VTSDEAVTVVLDGGEMLVDKLVAADPGSVRTAGGDQVTAQMILLASAVKLTATGARYKPWGSFFGESKLLWVWDSTPAEGKRQVDIAYLLGIGYGF